MKKTSRRPPQIHITPSIEYGIPQIHFPILSSIPLKYEFYTEPNYSNYEDSPGSQSGKPIPITNLIINRSQALCSLKPQHKQSKSIVYSLVDEPYEEDGVLHSPIINTKKRNRVSEVNEFKYRTRICSLAKKNSPSPLSIRLTKTNFKPNTQKLLTTMTNSIIQKKRPKFEETKDFKGEQGRLRENLIANSQGFRMKTIGISLDIHPRHQHTHSDSQSASHLHDHNSSKSRSYFYKHQQQQYPLTERTFTTTTANEDHHLNSRTRSPRISFDPEIKLQASPAKPNQPNYSKARTPSRLTASSQFLNKGMPKMFPCGRVHYEPERRSNSYMATRSRSLALVEQAGRTSFHKHIQENSELKSSLNGIIQDCSNLEDDTKVFERMQQEAMDIISEKRHQERKKSRAEQIEKEQKIEALKFSIKKRREMEKFDLNAGKLQKLTLTQKNRK